MNSVEQILQQISQVLLQSLLFLLLPLSILKRSAGILRRDMAAAHRFQKAAASFVCNKEEVGEADTLISEHQPLAAAALSRAHRRSH